MISFTLPLPPSVNAMYRNVQGRGRVKTEVYKTWLASAWGHWLEQGGKKLSESGPYELTIKVPQKMRGDCDNRIKAISDALVMFRVTDDDRHCRRLSIRRGDVSKGFCEVTVCNADA